MSKQSSSDFSGRVAIVTGAGNGMGRQFAISLADRGCTVVVNDYGGDPKGQGRSAVPAEIVASEIRDRGGQAIADNNAVGTPEAARAIVDTAMAAFGRVDILINNAGISAPGPVDGPDDDRVAAVLQTNLAGPLALTRAVWPLMRDQGYGRILNVSSNAAFSVGGSVAYAASKAGLLGLTFETGGLGEPFGIKVNAILPVAYTRMIEGVQDRNFVDWMKANMSAEKVAAAVVYLVSERCPVSGQVFSVGGGRVARAAFMGGPGLFDPALTPERLDARQAEMESLDSPRLIASSRDDMAPLFELCALPGHDQAYRPRGLVRDLAMFNCALDSKLRACDLVRLRVSDVAPGGGLRQRSIVIQQKTGRPVPFEITEPARDAITAWLSVRGQCEADWLP